MSTPLDDHLRRAGRGSASALARQAGISLTHLSDIRRGRKRPSLTLAVRLAQLTGMPIEAFAGKVPR